MTLKDDRKLKDMNTMSAGKTPSKVESGMSLTLHGHPVTVITTDSDDTVISYANGACRFIATNDLNGYLDLGTFPTGTRLTRPSEDGLDAAHITAVTGNCCYQLDIRDEDDNLRTVTFSYADFISWHMTGGDNAPEMDLPAGAKVYTPKHPATATEPEALAFGQARIDELFEKLAKANKTIDDNHIAAEIKLNASQREVFDLKALIAAQQTKHAAELAARDTEIDALKTKASLLKSPVRQFMVRLNIYERELNDFARDGWQVQHMQFSASDDLNVVVYRDLPTEPAPRVTVAETAAAIYDTPVTVATPRPPVQVPPPTVVPALNQVIVGVEAPASRPLTNNVSRVRGETRRIPELRQQVQMQREQDAAELAAIFDKGAEAQEALRRKFAAQSNPFPVATGVQS